MTKFILASVMAFTAQVAAQTPSTVTPQTSTNPTFSLGKQSPEEQEIASLRRQITALNTTIRTKDAALAKAYQELGERMVLIAQLQDQMTAGTVGDIRATATKALAETVANIEKANPGHTLNTKTWKLEPVKADAGKGGSN